jgi:arginyl-tRNA--protein-N-Asp/Glu arginylyltransferase
VAQLLRQIVEGPDACQYLPARQATTDTRIVVGDTAEELEAMLIRGWRRFGPVQFRPACATCGECVPLRIPVADFRPSRSQRRAARACAGLRVVIGPPRVDEERLALYRVWHRSREQARQWAPSELDARDYRLQLAFPHPAARELAYYDDAPGPPARLVGLATCDETPRAWNATYFFYDPAYARRSIGVANILRQIDVARARGIPHVYLGFRVLACQSMRYKAAFRPHELLQGRPGFDEEPQWRRARPSSDPA